MAFDEFLSNEMNDYFTSETKFQSGRRNHSALYIGPSAMANSFEVDQAALRRAKSAESILCSPRIILNRYDLIFLCSLVLASDMAYVVTLQLVTD